MGSQPERLRHATTRAGEAQGHMTWLGKRPVGEIKGPAARLIMGLEEKAQEQLKSICHAG